MISLLTFQSDHREAVTRKLPDKSGSADFNFFDLWSD
jgi:hypothetical protein